MDIFLVLIAIIVINALAWSMIRKDKI